MAIKILKVGSAHLDYSSKEEALLCLQSEVNILHECAQLKISNVVKIKDCSFDGTIVKELSPDQSSSDNSDRVCRQLQRLELSDSDDSGIIKRKHPVCYYVMSFAK